MSNDQQKRDSNIGALFFQMKAKDIAYYTAVLNMCITSFHNGDGGGVYVHFYELAENYGLAQNIERQEVNIDLVCKVLCARGFRVSDSKEYENFMVVSWSPGYIDGQEPVFELPEDSDMD